MTSWILENGKLLKSSDEMKLLKQSIENLLLTPAYEFAIYSFNYGNQALNHLNMSDDWLSAKMTEFLTNALLIDDRIKSISDVSTIRNGENLEISFTVLTTTNDTINIESEVVL